MDILVGVLGSLITIATFLFGTWRFARANKYRIYARRAARFQNTIRAPHFNQWQSDVLRRLYGGAEAIAALGVDYPVVCYPAPHDFARPLEKLASTDLASLQEHHTRRPNAIQSEFLSALGSTVTRPNSIAYALRELSFNDDGQVIGYTAIPCTFRLGLITSFVLEYELYKAYPENHSGLARSPSGDRGLAQLPMRMAIHQHFVEEAVLHSGLHRFAMLSVQMMIVFKSHEDGQYRTFLIKRSDKVSYGPGTWQFVPCGYFEMFDTLVNKYSLNSNFDSRLAVFREMLEELFGKREYIENPDGIPSDDIMNDENIRFVTQAIERGQAHIRWLGSVLDLITLTHKLSYLLVIDDPEFSTRVFTPNFEARHLQMPAIQQIGDVVESDRFLPESAGLLHMALDHPLVKQRLFGGE